MPRFSKFVPLLVFYILSAVFIVYDAQAFNVLLWTLRVVIGVVVGVTLVLVFVIIDLIALGGLTNRNFFKMNDKNKRDD